MNIKGREGRAGALGLDGVERLSGIWERRMMAWLYPQAYAA